MLGGQRDPGRARDRIRNILLVALQAARYGTPPAPSIAESVMAGGRDLTLDQLQFDSLAWMEFCISVELATGQELTPTFIDGMKCFFEIEEWLYARE